MNGNACTVSGKVLERAKAWDIIASQIELALQPQPHERDWEPTHFIALVPSAECTAQAARLQERERSERAARDAALRKGLIGSGDRSDRIRTYNFPQGRLTDHRINLTLYKLEAILEGALDDVVRALRQAREAEQLAELEVGAS